jgi:hypothetical protein
MMMMPRPVSLAVAVDSDPVVAMVMAAMLRSSMHADPPAHTRERPLTVIIGTGDSAGITPRALGLRGG